MEPPSVLVIEDEYITSTDIENTLAASGFAVAGTAGSGPDAIRLAGELKPDIVLMDITLDGPMNGIEAARRIRERDNIPVVFLTAHSDDATVGSATSSEPFGYLVKPVDGRALAITLKMALFKHAMEGRLRQSEEMIRLLLDATDDSLFLIDGTGMFLAVNNGLARRIGVPVAELNGTSAYELVCRRVFTPRMACWNLPPGKGTMFRFEEELGGRWYDTKIVAGPGDGAGGVAYAGYIRDITSLKRAEEQMRRNEQYFRGLVDNASDVIAILDSEGRFRNESPSLLSALGIRGGILAGRTIYDLIHPENFPLAKKIFTDTMEHPSRVRPFRLKFRKGGGGVCVIEGILSNLADNPAVSGVVLNGWIRGG